MEYDLHIEQTLQVLFIFLDLGSSLSKHSQGYCYHILLVENALEMTYHSESLVDI